VIFVGTRVFFIALRRNDLTALTSRFRLRKKSTAVELARGKYAKLAEFHYWVPTISIVVLPTIPFCDTTSGADPEGVSKGTRTLIW
jgi:hypothetical protein